MATVTINPTTLAAKLLDAFNTHNESAIKAMVAPQARLTGPGDVRLQGKDAVVGYFIGWLKGFPDARVTIRDEIVTGPWVVQEYTFEGTHRGTLAGPLGDIPATNKKLVGHGVTLTKFDNDLVVDARLYFDMVEILTQLGIMPVPVRA